MKKATHYLSVLLLAACFTQPASAQFEGKITFNSFEYAEDGTEQQGDEFRMYMTPDRILLQGQGEYDFMESIKTEGVLVRFDSQDFVILTDDDKALKISKSDITFLMRMLDNGSESSQGADKGSDINYKRTNKTETLKGYNCEKFIFFDEEDKNAHTEVWMTKDIDVNWGMLAELWSGSANEMIGSFPMDIVFKEKYFPLKVEEFKNDKLVSKLEATDIDKSTKVREMVKVPSGVQILSFQDYIFQKKSQ